ncbi:hypothetical protein DT075_27760 [Bacillus licheniformis]|nr:hypothetical protein DT075_27760 [Bacillus licheniformis]
MIQLVFAYLHNLIVMKVFHEGMKVCFWNIQILHGGILQSMKVYFHSLTNALIPGEINLSA